MSRTLLAATTVGIYTSFPIASETNPTVNHGGFAVKRPTGSTAKPLALQYYVRNTSTAKSGQDFQPLSGTVTIRAGKRGASIYVYAIDDSVPEPDKSLVLVLKTSPGFTIVRRTASVTIQNDDQPSQSSGWWNDAWDYRAAISVNVGSTARTDQPVDHPINFTSILSSLGKSGSLIQNSIRVVETSADGRTVLEENVPFQFDQASDYSALSKASGNLVFVLKGNTSANTTRYYHVYFDTSGSFSVPSVSPLITTTDGVPDEGYDSIRIDTPVANYYYQKGQGGFSSILDTSGNDWIGWHSFGGSDGEYRDIPNLVPARLHPGRSPTLPDGSTPDTMSTVIVSQGPIKTVLESTATTTGNKVRWEFYPKFARCTVLSIDRPYYFLYEGTPGGSISAGDTTVQSDDTVLPITATWDENTKLGSANGEEWVYFRDTAVGSSGRYMYFVHDTPDDLIDNYYDMEGNMTVFGFGRHNIPGDQGKLLTATPNVFTIGLADGGGTFSTAAATIKGAYKDLSTSQGTSEVKPV